MMPAQTGFDFDVIALVERLGSFGLLVYLAVHGIPAAIRYVSTSAEKVSLRSNEAIEKIADKFENINNAQIVAFNERHREMKEAVTEALSKLERVIEREKQCDR